MNSICEVCGVSAEIPDEALERHPIHFDCVGCGTHYYATRLRCGRITRRPTESKGRRRLRRLDATEPAPDEDRLSDLRSIVRQSSIPPPPAHPLEVLDAPPSLRQAIRLSDPPLPPPVTWTAEAPEGESEAGEPQRSARTRSTALGTVLVAALAVVVSLGRSHRTEQNRRAPARAGIEVTALAAGGRVVAAPIAAPRVEKKIASPEPPKQARRSAAAHRSPEPPAASAVATPSAPPPPPSEVVAPAPKPMSLQEAIAQAAGRPAASATVRGAGSNQ